MSEYIKRNQSKFLIIGLAGFSILIWSSAFRLPDKKLHIKVLDVGQGDSIFIRTPSGYKILIDGGPDNKIVGLLGESLPLWDKTLDLVVLTHPQADHMTGLIEVAKRYQIKTLWTSYSVNNTQVYKEWEKVVSERHLHQVHVWAGDKIIFPDGVDLNVIWPRSVQPYTDLNTTAIVIKLDYKNFDGLLTSDADEQVQPYTSSTSHVEFLKVPHHGSKTAIDENYLAKLSPDISVISVGAHNRYGHPNPELVKLLDSARTKVYRTDQNGTVEIVSDGESWYTKMER